MSQFVVNFSTVGVVGLAPTHSEHANTIADSLCTFLKPALLAGKSISLNQQHSLGVELVQGSSC